jgi:muramoyltetrapeptide carboxypeptidase
MKPTMPKKLPDPGHDHGHPHDGHHAHDHGAPARTLCLFSPAGVLVNKSAALTRARRRLKALGFEVSVDEAATARSQRFAGDDDTRLAALHRIAKAAPDIALATRGGYGLTRLLDRIDWPLLARSVEQGTRWVGHSDMTALQLGLLAHTGAQSWAGPLALDHFGRADDEGGVDEVTEGCFAEAMHGELEAIGFRTEAGFDGLEARGTLWGGNLTLLCSLLGTKHWPKVRGGILFLEDVNEHPYRVERMLLQLQQAGVLGAQKAVLLGDFSGWKKSPLDRGYNLKSTVAQLRSVCEVPLLTGLPFGHRPTLVTMPVGRKVDLVVQGRDTLVVWG